MATETKSIAQSVIDGFLFSLSKNNIDISGNIFIYVVKINSWRDNSCLDGFNG